MPTEDLFSRVVLKIDVKPRITAGRVIAVLQKCFRIYGKPGIIRTDHQKTGTYYRHIIGLIADAILPAKLSL